MEYSIKAIPTEYNGFTFRSRLEAKWAAMFDLLGWRWDYEPVDFNGWLPDFVIYEKSTIYVEVKPVTSFPEDIAKRISKSGCKQTLLIVGQDCSPSGYSEYDCLGHHFGWMTEPYFDEMPAWEQSDLDHLTDLDRSRIENDWWSEALLGRWKDGGGKIGFCHANGQYTDRISGGYDGGCYGGESLSSQEIKKMWAKAHSLTQWQKR